MLLGHGFGWGWLGELVWLAIVIYLLTLGTRAVRAIEKIAEKLLSKSD